MTWQIIAAVVGSGGLAGFLGSLVSGLVGRPKVKADAVAQLTDSALKQVNELQERTEEAEKSAREARQQVRMLSDEVEALLGRLRTWRAAILAESADLEQLRAMVRADPGAAPAVNGHVYR